MDSARRRYLSLVISHCPFFIPVVDDRPGDVSPCSGMRRRGPGLSSDRPLLKPAMSVVTDLARDAFTWTHTTASLWVVITVANDVAPWRTSAGSTPATRVSEPSLGGSPLIAPPAGVEV
jgi:hypothetical protein